MEVLSIIFGALATVMAGLNIFQFFNFKAYRAKYAAEAAKEQAEAEESKQSALERRLAAVEQLYEEQGATIDKLRKEILTLTEEKYSNDKRILQLEGENGTLKERVGQLEKQVDAYKTIIEKQ